MPLLDTHTFVWLASGQKELSAKAATAIKKDLDSLFTSVVTAREIAWLHKKGRLHLALPSPEFVERAIRHHGVQELPLTREVSMASVSLRDFHNVPFDRILVAVALKHRCRVVTKDTKISLYPRLVTI